MKADDRRKEIALYLMSSDKPVSGTALSNKFGVSRQIIVQDVAILKALGYQIMSTHYGYIITKAPFAEKVFKVYHTKERTEDELNTIISLGGIIVDVFVWHKVYGKMVAKLNIYNQEHVQKFIDGVRSGKSTELMDITGGYHYHTVRADDENVLEMIESALKEKGFLSSGD